MPDTRSKLVTAAAIGAAALGGAAIANAASSGTTTSTSSTPSAATHQGGSRHDPSQGGHTVNGKTETLLTDGVKAKVQAAALAKVPGTVERVETNVDSSAPYEAHIVKSDGTEVEVQVNKDYSVAAVNEHGPGGPGGAPGAQQ